MRRTLLAAAVLGAPLAACSGTLYQNPGTAATAFDGTYSGTVTYIHSAPNGCPSTEPAPGKLTVQNGSVLWPASSGLTLYAPVVGDGSFTAANGTIRFSGKITQRAMVARVNTGSCHQIYDLTKPA